jgi:hypothetical protein
MIDLTKLTQEQLWGVQYARQTRNEQLQGEIEGATNRNVWIKEQNAIRREEAQLPLEPVPTLYTDQSYADFIFAQQCNQWYSQLIAVKEQLVLNMARQLPKEQMEALLTQFGVPDVIK